MATSTPSGRHTPVTNISQEAVAILDDQMEDPDTGSEEGVVEAVGSGEAAAAEASRSDEGAMFEARAPAEPEVPDTSGLPDIGVASFGDSSASVLEAVLGTDERVRIHDTAKYPYRALASLLITARDGSEWIGTGWFVSPRTLVTAGHCVYIKRSGIPARDGWVRSIRVLAGRNGNQAPFGTVVASQFWSVKGWTEDGDENFDYAAIIVPEPLGSRVGTFGFGVFTDAALAGQIINITGYPGDKPSGEMWHDSRVIASTSPTKVHYAADTAGGQSGAPAYIIRDGRRYGVAVHAYGGVTTNSGTRISPPVYQNLRNWRA
jgi:V8-like Glu-specific endopeptidase